MIKTCEDVNQLKSKEELPYGIRKEQIYTYAEFERYKKDKESTIEDILENADYYGYKFYTILFINDTADEVFIKITE